MPGLFYWRNFVELAEHDALVAACLKLRGRVRRAAGSEPAKRANIPQPKHVQSAAHNLATSETFVPLRVRDTGGGLLRCEYFERYGEDGHELAYFRGNTNIPRFVHKSVIDAGARVRARACACEYGERTGTVSSRVPVVADLFASKYRHVHGHPYAHVHRRVKRHVHAYASV